MRHHFHPDPVAYTGQQLANHWIYRQFGILGDAVVAFTGPCHVDLDSMVDLEDVLNEDHIYSEHMLHFIVELFGASLKEGVLVQRLFTAILADRLQPLLANKAGLTLHRSGDDLFVNESKKLSVSICTVSPTSILIHTGLNIESDGTPVETAGLRSDLSIGSTTSLDDVTTFATVAMRTLCQEWLDIRSATCKVRAVS
ncbi:MAG: DUF366 family protein [Vampirovibrionales bacterium]|nr:DUF366 family protein [Vampirovibrionales bacterium]